MSFQDGFLASPGRKGVDPRLEMLRTGCGESSVGFVGGREKPRRGVGIAWHIPHQRRPELRSVGGRGRPPLHQHLGEGTGHAVFGDSDSQLLES
jgi:hypothetical protein